MDRIASRVVGSLSLLALGTFARPILAAAPPDPVACHKVHGTGGRSAVPVIPALAGTGCSATALRYECDSMESGRDGTPTRCYRVKCRRGVRSAAQRATLVCVPPAGEATTHIPTRDEACSAAGQTCGSLPDACGGVVDCGGCLWPQSCGGGGVPGTCGAPPACTDSACDCQALLASIPYPHPVPQFPPSLDVPGSCNGGQSSNYAVADASNGATEELHVIGVYEASSDPGLHDHPQGRVDVVVHARPKPVVLFLSAYEAVTWHITVDPGATLTQIITQGYYDQTVVGAPAGVSITPRAQEQTCAYAYGWEAANNAGGGSWELMMASARALTGLSETSFQGCYNGARFEVPYWTGAPPTGTATHVAGDETVAREAMRFTGCESVMAEHDYCLTTTYGSVALLGLDSGTVCPIASTTAPIATPDTNSIAWRGEVMYACSYDAGLLRVSLRDGSWEAVNTPCDAVAAHGDHLLVMPGIAASSTPELFGSLFEYPDFAALLDGRPNTTFQLGDWSTRMTVAGDTYYGAWHATDSITVADLATRRQLGVLSLGGYDGWILGMSVTADGRLVVSGDTWGDTVYVFDTGTGAQLGTIHPTSPVFGLSCVRPG